MAQTRKRAGNEEEVDERWFYASQAMLIWWKFRKHKLAVVSIFVLGFFYIIAAFGEFLAPYTATTDSEYLYAAPQRIRIRSSEGRLERPFVYELRKVRDQKTLRQVWVEDTTREYMVRFLYHGVPYRMWGAIPADLHLIGTTEGPFFLLGSDRFGRDLLSRVIYGTRISVTIGLVGIAISFVLGLTLGGISGYFGGAVDGVIQRIIDFLISIPTLPLWMALSAALPRSWSVVQMYFAITLIFSMVGWTGLARVVRGKLRRCARRTSPWRPACWAPRSGASSGITCSPRSRATSSCSSRCPCRA